MRDHRQPRFRGPGDDLRHLLGAGDGDAEIVRLALVGGQHPGGAGSERAVAEDFHAADAQKFIAKPCAQSQTDGAVQFSDRDLGDCAQREFAVRAQLLKGAQRGGGLLRVDADDPHAVGDLLRLAHCGHRLLRGRLSQAGEGQLHRLFQQNAARLPICTAHDLAAVRVCCTDCDTDPFQGAAVHPGGMAALARQKDRMLRRDRVQLRRRREGAALPDRLIPAATGQPLAGARIRSPPPHPFQRR